MKPIRRFVLILVVALPFRAEAQSGTLLGRVLDAGTGLPVAAAVVTIEPAAAGLLIDARAAIALTRVRTIVTGESGQYRFSEIAPGSYRLRIERLGYRAATVDVDVRRPVEAAVSIGLELAPVALEPVRVDHRAASLFHRAVNGPAELDEARVASERLRQALFVAPDARMLTYADVMDGVTLGEGDVFRALQRFPGVGTRDDYTAELWTRGAPWTHTRVTFDGIPLFNPVHAVGVLSAITPEVLGAAFFHPGVRPASIGDGAAGVVDLRSRAGGGTGELRGTADLSMASAKLVLDQNIGAGSWVLAARRSHLGVLTQGLGSLGLDTVDLPYVFHDLAGRVDVRVAGRTWLEASGLWEQDRIEGDVEGVIERTTARWGNGAGRVTLRHTMRGLEWSHTLGGSAYAVRTDDHLVRTREPVPWTEPASRNEIKFAQLTGQLTSMAGNSTTGWSIGYDLSHQRGTYDGPLPRYYAVKPDTVARLRFQRELVLGAVWGDARIKLGKHVTLNPALRVESGDAFADAARVRVSPRLAARVTLSADQSISIAAGRSWQYLQAIALAGPSIHPAFHASHFWVWPDARTPAIQADLVSLG
ncbi:MAG: TonB-dependent receptor domain-containing protein, partial [Longimicrobiales bacterium]